MNFVTTVPETLSARDLLDGLVRRKSKPFGLFVILVLVLVAQGHYSWVFELSRRLAARAVWCVRGVPSNRRVKLSTIKRVSDD